MDRERRCIKCQERPLMAVQQINEMSVDICPICHGMWLDRDELRRLSVQPDELAALRARVGAGEGTEEPSTTTDLCPACHRKLGVASIGVFHVEYCVGCGGMFLDRGELQMVATALGESESKSMSTIVALARSVVVSGSMGE